MLGQVHLHFGRYEQALDDFQRAVSLGGGMSIYSGFYAHACAVGGRRDEAERVVRELEQEITRHVSRGLLCLAYVALGQRDEAMRCLELAYEQHDAMLLSMPVSELWNPIRDTDVFRDILRRMNFPAPSRLDA